MGLRVIESPCLAGQYVPHSCHDRPCPWIRPDSHRWRTESCVVRCGSRPNRRHRLLVFWASWCRGRTASGCPPTNFAGSHRTWRAECLLRLLLEVAIAKAKPASRSARAGRGRCDLYSYLVSGSNLALPAERHHDSSRQLSVTAAKLRPRYGQAAALAGSASVHVTPRVI